MLSGGHSREKLLELLRLTPEPHLREGYVMVFLNAADDYVRAILHDFPERVVS